MSHTMDTHNFLLCMVALCNTCTCHFNSHVVSALNDSGSSENLIARVVRIRCTCRSPAHPLARANSLINKLARPLRYFKGFYCALSEWVSLEVREEEWKRKRGVEKNGGNVCQKRGERERLRQTVCIRETVIKDDTKSYWSGTKQALARRKLAVILMLRAIR